ncbi:MAG: stage III sporulation AC/AD family protein [Eubacteriales bacterium]|nr:stage III sporulation AC/AD family protein [Eubacteriales bacterium]
MNEILKIASIGLITVFLSMILKSCKSEQSVLISLAGGLVIISLCIPIIKSSVFSIINVVKNTGVETGSILLVIRIIVITYIAEFAAGTAKDSGNAALAMKIELGGKLIVFSICIPVLISIIESIMQLIV